MVTHIHLYIVLMMGWKQGEMKFKLMFTPPWCIPLLNITSSLQQVLLICSFSLKVYAIQIYLDQII